MSAAGRSMRAVAAVAAALLTMAAMLAAVPIGSANAAVEPTGAVLDGYWRFAIADDPIYAAPTFDDSTWVELLAPETGGQYELDDVNAIAWFRKSFTLPAETAGAPMWASLGVIDDADEVYINGTLVGASGAFPPNAATAFFHHRLYEIPAGVLSYGPDHPNLIAVRVSDTGGGGGIARGPLGVFTRDEVRRALFGVELSLVDAGERATVAQAIADQSAALTAGDLAAYEATLDPAFFHSGHDAARQVARMDRLVTAHPGIERNDEILEIGVSPDGRYVAEIRRTWSDDGVPVAEEVGIAHAPQTGPDKAIEFVYFDPATLLEVGNHSRFYRDFVESTVSNARREFNVYLPPSYFTDTERHYPSVYVLHGAGGRNRQWEGVDLDRRVERLIDEGYVDEMIVITPSGRSPDNRDTWYVDTSVEQWRTMFFTELLPQVDATYRTIDDRTKRGITGWSMGGQGAFTTAWAGQDQFGSIASLSGALDLPPLAGSATEIAANSPETPNVQVVARDPLFLRSYCYWLYAGEDDDFAFDEATRAMMVELAAKTVVVEAEIKPGGQHNGHTELPGLTPAFRLHSLAFDAHDELLGCQATVPVNRPPTAADDVAATSIDTPVAVQVLDNDSDVDHDLIRLESVSAPGNGTARIEFDGSITYRPNAGFVGTDTFTYSVDDGRAGSDTATVTINVNEVPDTPATGRVHGSGHWDRIGEEVEFSFDAWVDSTGRLRGELEVEDDDADVEIEAELITSLGNGAGVDCNGTTLDGERSFVFTAVGEFESDDTEVDTAEFFACGIDNGDPRAGARDLFYVEVTSGATYSTAGDDDHIDGGNIRLFEPIGGASQEAPPAGEADDDGGPVVDLDPMFANPLGAGTPLSFTVTVHGAEVEGTEVQIRWLTDQGATGEVSTLTDSAGLAVVPLAVPLGTTSFTASVAGIDSNSVRVTGT